MKAVRLLGLLLVVGLATPGRTAPQQLPSSDVIHLKSRDIVIAHEGVSPAFLAQLRTTPLPRLHAFVQLRARPDLQSARALETAGIALLFHLTPDLWVASVARALSARDPAVVAFVRWMGEIEAIDKVSPELWQQQLYPWAAEADGRLRLSVEMFRDVSRSEAEALLRLHTSDLQPWVVATGWYILADRGAVRALARDDRVKWIEQGPVPFLPFVNFTRAAIHVDEVQEFDPPTASYAGLTGAGVRVGVWDEGIDGRHDDFLLHDAGGAVIGSRIVLGGAGGDHGTEVSGIIGGSGYRSAACGSLSYLYRGMAPAAEFVARFPGRFGPALLGIEESIDTYGMDVSNHSYLQEWNGRYGGTAQQMDEVVRGVAEVGGRRIPPRAMVWAAGNNGEFPEYSDVEGYFSVEAPAKNVITVGATIAGVAGAARNHLARFSALGPTWDGRIKPEVVAPGDSVTTTANGTDCYTVQSGTSLAAPAVTGTLALMLQQYGLTYGVDLDVGPPLPSTLKAVLVQTAADLADTTPGERFVDWVSPDTGADVQYHAGPDYATGYGLVNALAAVDLITEKKVVEDRVASRADVHDREIVVGAGTERIQFTLVWDDEPFEGVYAPDTAPRLVNDLELRLLAPDGSVHLPWVLDPLTPAFRPGDPDPIEPADIRPAGRGADHLNNLEQVSVDRPLPGRWIVRVAVAETSPGLLREPQPYSLVGDFYSRLYFTDWAEEPGSVYEIRDGGPRAIFTAPGEPLVDDHVYHSAFAPDGRLFVSNANENAVMEAGGPGDWKPVFRHKTYVRDLAFDPAGKFYFSEASGADADGYIYQLDLGTSLTTVVYTVRLSDVGGYWAGDFTFDPAGILYLSSGNHVPGHLFKVVDLAGSPVEVYALSGEAIAGIAFNRRGELFLTNWNATRGNIYRLSLADGRRDLVYSFPGRRIWDISFR